MNELCLWCLKYGCPYRAVVRDVWAQVLYFRRGQGVVRMARLFRDLLDMNGFNPHAS